MTKQLTIIVNDFATYILSVTIIVERFNGCQETTGWERRTRYR